MSYILIEESVFKKLMERIKDNTEDNFRYDFTESDYWMNGKEVCDYLQISQALLNSYRKGNILCYCRIKEVYHYKRADVYNLKAKMDRELIDSGLFLLECVVVDDEEHAYTELIGNNRGV